MTDPRSERDADTLRQENAAKIRAEEVLIQLAVRAEMERADSPYYTDERVIAWVSAEADSRERQQEGWSSEKISTAAARMRAKAEAARLKVRLVAGPPPVERASVSGLVSEVLTDARAVRAAPQLDLSAAAGHGRDLWDEPCDQWVRVPDDVPDGKYVSLRVTGDSMDPMLHTGDSVLVQMGDQVVRDTVVLARVPDAGYVVKKVSKVTRRELELQSLNDAFPPITVSREKYTVVGTVILRWCPHSRANDSA